MDKDFCEGFVYIYLRKNISFVNSNLNNTYYNMQIICIQIHLIFNA